MQATEGRVACFAIPKIGQRLPNAQGGAGRCVFAPPLKKSAPLVRSPESPGVVDIPEISPRIRARRRTAAGCVQLGHRTTTPGIQPVGLCPACWWASWPPP